MKTVLNFANFAVISSMALSIKFYSLCENIWRRRILSVTAMDTIDVQSMELDLTLQITQSRFCWHASCRVGALGEQCPHSLINISFIFYSVDAMQNGITWMTILQDGAPTNWHVHLLRLWKRIHYGMTTASLVISWYVMAAYQTPACPYCVFLSRLPMAFLVPTFTSCFPPTFSTKLLKEHSKITWWPGWQIISSSSTHQLRPNRFLLTLTGGKSSHSRFIFIPVTHLTLLALPQRPPSLAFVASLKVVDSNNGREMIQRHWWRYVIYY